MENTSPPTQTKPPETGIAANDKFSIDGYDGFITVGFYEDGRPCEIFICMQSSGSMIEQLFNQVAKLISLLLQYGVPLGEIAKHFDTRRNGNLTINPFVPSLPDRITGKILALVMKASEKQRSNVLSDTG